MTTYTDFLAKLNANREKIEQRQTGDESPPLALVNQVKDHRAAIRRTEQLLAGEIEEADWQLQMKPLLAAIEARTGPAASDITAGDAGLVIERSSFGGDAPQVVNQVLAVVKLHIEGQASAGLRPVLEEIATLLREQVSASEALIVENYFEDPANYQDIFRQALSQLVAQDRGLPARLDALLARLRTEPGTGHRAKIRGRGAIAQGEGARSAYADRGGTAFTGDIGGDVTLGNRNVSIKDNEIKAGDRSVIGSQAGGDIITGSGNIRAGRDYVGRDRNSGVSDESLVKIFADLRRQVDTNEKLDAEKKEDVKAELKELEKIATQPGAISPAEEDSFIRRRLQSINNMAPDILETIAALVVNPVGGLATIWQKIVDRAKQIQAKREQAGPKASGPQEK